MLDKHHHNKGEVLNFSGFSGYYGAMSAQDGYGGFNYLDDFLVMNASTWTKPDGVGYENGWCDTGYQNVAAAAKATSLAWIYEYGVMESYSSKTFALESFMATASWSANEAWDVISYTESNGYLTEKGEKEISVTFSKAQTVKFKGADWKGIAAIAFSLVSEGSPGNTCTYGTAEYGVQLCIDRLKVKFSNKADLRHNGGNLQTPYMLHHQQHNGAHVAAVSQAAHDISAAHWTDSNSAHPQTDGGYHSQLLSLGNDTGLTGQFHLPSVEHFA
jgi:hypothetical protein